MPSAVLELSELLGAVRCECTVSAIIIALGKKCHRATIWRALGRAEVCGLVTSTRDIGVWEITSVGERTLAGDGDRPRCPECKKPAGSRLELDALEVYRLVPRRRLCCRVCRFQWSPTAFDLELAEARDRGMSSTRDELAAAIALHEEARQQ